MAFCPGCGYEFREGLKRCPDCDMDLVASLEEADAAGRLRGGKTVSVFCAQRSVIEMLADMLDQEGIPSLVKAADPSSHSAATDPLGSPLAELHVLAEDADANAELIRDLIAELAAQRAGE